MNRYRQQKSLKIKVSSSAIKNARAKVLGRRLWILGVGSGGGRALWDGGKEARADLPQENSPWASGKAEKELASSELSTLEGPLVPKVQAMQWVSKGKWWDWEAISAGGKLSWARLKELSSPSILGRQWTQNLVRIKIPRKKRARSGGLGYKKGRQL